MFSKYLPGLIIIICLFLSFSSCHNNRNNTPANSAKGLNDSTDAFTADSFAYYENALAADSFNSALRMALATNYYAEKQYNKAIEHLLKVFRNNKNNPEVIITLGNVYYDSDQYEKAIVFYEKVLVTDSKNVNVRCDLATCYLNIKKPEKACTLLKKNIEIDSDHAQSHHNLSVVYSQLGKTREAEEEMKLFNKLSGQ
jgi:tetratricopeptide (TPR) repeat protein